MNTPLISIIIPTYNREKFLKRTILSVQNQTINDWELLIIDDGSTDDTQILVKEFSKKDYRIKYFYQKNSGGPAGPRNKGIENSRGEFIAFLDSDDEWMPEKLEKQLKMLNSSKNGIDAVSCFLCVKNNSTNKIISRYENLQGNNNLKNFTKGNYIFTPSCMMIKSSILKKIGYFDTNFKWSDDWDMWIRILENNSNVDFVPEYLVNYFVHENNIWYRNKNSNKKNEFNVFFNKHKNLFFKYNTYGVGYYYFNKKEYDSSKKYFSITIFSQDANFKEKIKSFIYLFLSLILKKKKN